MEKYLNTSIKEVITKFPAVGKILEEYNIGCVPCALGSCLLKDIVSIHNLAPEDESRLMYRIEKIIYPDRDVNVPALKGPVKTATVKEIKYSPPIKRLVDEHALIKKWLALIPVVIETIDVGSPEGKSLVLDGLDFIRNYADKFHHAKEEDILFGYVGKDLDIIKTMLADHDAARGHVRAAMEALKNGDKKSVIEHLNGYGELLAEHIKKEDEILYPWIDRSLSTKQVGEIFSKFAEAEAKIDKEVVQRCERFAKEIGERVRIIKKAEVGDLGT